MRVEELLELFRGRLIEQLLDEPDPESRARLERDLGRWREQRSFVLYWGNDLWLDGAGHVTST